jgi:hypothetical protein
MKIAVLFSGRIYKFGSHYNNIMENVVQDHEADFYLSHSPELNEEAELELFKEMYNPVAVCNDPIPDFDFNQYPVIDELYTKRRNVVCMHYNRKRVFELMKKSGKIYDCIVSYRLDLFSQSKIDYTNLGKSIYIPEGQDFNGGINDQVAYGTYEPMSIYMNLFDSMKQYLDEKKTIFFPELLNQCHLFENNISIIRVPYNYKIIRGGHSLFN